MRLREIISYIMDYSFISLAVASGTLIAIFELFNFGVWYTLIVLILNLIIVIIKEIREKHKTNQEKAEEELTDEKIEHIDQEVTTRNDELAYKQRVISEFLKYGVVKEEDILSNLNQEPFIILYHFNRKINKEIEPFLPDNTKAINKILADLGFVPVGAYTGSYFFHVVGANSLPRELNNIAYLEAYIKRKMKNSWKKMWGNMEEKNKDLYQKYKDDKDKRVNFSYFLGKVFPSNLSIGYLNFSSFDNQFLSYYSKFTNSRKIEVDKQKLNDLLSMASISFFINLIELNDRKQILKNETQIKKNLSIKSLLDYESVSETQWNNELRTIFKDDLEKCGIYAKTIWLTVQKYLPVIKEFI
jgi:uncharacterized membrane protein